MEAPGHPECGGNPSVPQKKKKKGPWAPKLPETPRAGVSPPKEGDTPLPESVKKLKGGSGGNPGCNPRLLPTRKGEPPKGPQLKRPSQKGVFPPKKKGLKGGSNKRKMGPFKIKRGKKLHPGNIGP